MQFELNDDTCFLPITSNKRKSIDDNGHCSLIKAICCLNLMRLPALCQLPSRKIRQLVTNIIFFVFTLPTDIIG